MRNKCRVDIKTNYCEEHRKYVAEGAFTCMTGAQTFPDICEVCEFHNAMKDDFICESCMYQAGDDMSSEDYQVLKDDIKVNKSGE